MRDKRQPFRPLAKVSVEPDTGRVQDTITDITADTATDTEGPWAAIEALEFEPEPLTTEPVSFAEAAKILNVNADTLRKRHWPRVAEALSDRDVVLQVQTGQTKAGSPIYKLTPLAVELLADFQMTAGDVQAIEGWQRQTADRFPRLPVIEAIEQAQDDSESEPEEPAGALALVAREDAAIVVDGEWITESSEIASADFASARQSQLDLGLTMASAGESLAMAFEQLADKHAAEAAARYSARLQANLSTVLGGATEASTGQTTAKKSRAKSAVGAAR